MSITPRLLSWKEMDRTSRILAGGVEGKRDETFTTHVLESVGATWDETSANYMFPDRNRDINPGKYPHDHQEVAIAILVPLAENELIEFPYEKATSCNLTPVESMPFWKIGLHAYLLDTKS